MNLLKKNHRRLLFYFEKITLTVQKLTLQKNGKLFKMVDFQKLRK